MAEVPPGPNALPSPPSDITALPVDGCTLLGKDEGLEIITPGPGPHQHAGDHKAIVKSNQNNVHPNALGAQFHSAQLNGVQCNHAHLQNHVQHRTSDSQSGASDHHPDSIGETQGDHTENNNLTRNKRCNDISQSQLSPNNGINCTDRMAITESSSCQVENDVRSRTGTVDKARAAEESGPGPQGARVEQHAAADDSAPVAEMSRLALEEHDESIRYVRYESELQMPDIIRLITKDLSEPYSIYTYRYFIHNWPQLCFLAMVEKDCVGAIVCKLDMHKKMFRRGYIAMLAVDSKFRRKGIGTNLVKKAIFAMVEGDCDEVVLETEITNKSALKLYENLGFVRDKRLFRYYLNGVDALRLKLWLR
ncbi:N-alpha-acetyltransferase 30-like [Myxocyprinus asiaticus]|uniref:N-alpha-acetyltransferase 30-like n=1 Tax=Myxocyprinus asiaticus TaxID=70543 RepID=UPI0022227E5D|nr:N-alpha-acetyltransferase 30-like [Myxocyprinus asiaticus]